MQDAAASYRNCILAVSAANVALHLLTAADMPKAVYMEELVVNIISLLKYQLQYNVLAFWDDRLWKMWRSSQDGRCGSITALCLADMMQTASHRRLLGASHRR